MKRLCALSMVFVLGMSCGMLVFANVFSRLNHAEVEKIKTASALLFLIAVLMIFIQRRQEYMNRRENTSDDFKESRLLAEELNETKALMQEIWWHQFLENRRFIPNLNQTRHIWDSIR